MVNTAVYCDGKLQLWFRRLRNCEFFAGSGFKNCPGEKDQHFADLFHLCPADQHYIYIYIDINVYIYTHIFPTQFHL